MKNRKGLIRFIAGSLILAAFILFAAFPQAFTPFTPKQTDTPWLPVSAEHILGTNDMGYDIFTELIYAARHTIVISTVSGILSLILGVFIGFIASTGGRLLREAVNALINVFVMLPKLVLILILAAFMGRSRGMVIFIITLLSWPGTAKVVRAQILHINEQPFIKNGYLMGYSKPHNMLRHYLPNLFTVLVPRFLSGISSIMMMESTLAFLGLGDLYNPSWGTMVNFAYNRGAFLKGAWNWLLSPGICIALVSFGLYLISCSFEAGRESAPD